MQLNQYYQGVEVLNYFQYSIKANGKQKKIFTVLDDENNNNELTRYFYDGDGIIGSSRRVTNTGNIRGPKIQSITSSSIVTPNFNNDELVIITEQNTSLTLANPSGTPTNGQSILIRMKAISLQIIAYGSQYRAIGITLPTIIGANKTIYLGCIWNSEDTKFDVIGNSLEE